MIYKKSPLPQLLVNALEGKADPYDLGVVTGVQIAQYFWSETREIGISPREGKLPGGYFDRGEFLFREGLFEPPAEEDGLASQPFTINHPTVLNTAEFSAEGRIVRLARIVGINGEAAQGLQELLERMVIASRAGKCM